MFKFRCIAIFPSVAFLLWSHCFAFSPNVATRTVHLPKLVGLNSRQNEINLDMVSARQRDWKLQMASSSPTSNNNELVGQLVSASSFVAMDVAFRRIFKAANISFPSSLAGCGILFAALSLIKFVTGSDRIRDSLESGAALLAKWSAVFFVPSLVLLPLADSLGGAAEILKVGTVVVFGFLFTLLSTAVSVSAVRMLSGSESTSNAQAIEAPAAKPSNPFSDETFQIFYNLSIGFALLTTFFSKTGNALRNPAQSAYLLLTTLTAFLFGFRVQEKMEGKVVHPLVQCTLLTWVGSKIIGMLTGTSFKNVLKTFKTGSLSPMTGGAGDILLFLLGPTVVSFGWQMYNRSKLIKENLKEVSTAVVTSSVGGLFGTAAAVRLLGILKPSLRLALISRNITSPLAIAIGSILGADISYAVTLVVISGLIGANSGASILTKFNILDPVARGLSIGAAAHGLGTAAFVNEKEAFPFSAVSMALTASLSTVLISIPAIRSLIVQIALG